jgi:hypothetical protein
VVRTKSPSQQLLGCVGQPGGEEWFGDIPLAVTFDDEFVSFE